MNLIKATNSKSMNYELRKIDVDLIYKYKHFKYKNLYT